MSDLHMGTSKVFSKLNARLLTVYISYGRIETLSGFANGIFLILISIFIIFEAIQRMYVHHYSVSDILSNKSHLLYIYSMEPPEMNTNQLLLVSSLGLGVNLFGMFAMGGHHHHVSFISNSLEFNYSFLLGRAFSLTRSFAFLGEWYPC